MLTSNNAMYQTALKATQIHADCGLSNATDPDKTFRSNELM